MKSRTRHPTPNFRRSVAGSWRRNSLARCRRDFQRDLATGRQKKSSHRMKPMSRSQAYTYHTDRIRNAFKGMVDVLPDILAVHDQKLWREKWSSFKEYCEKEFGKSRARAYQLIEAARAMEPQKLDTESG